MRLGLSGSRLEWGSFRAASMSLRFLSLPNSRKVLRDHPSTIPPVMDISARDLIKGAAKFEKHSDFEDFLSRSAFECMVRLREGLQARLLQCLCTNGRRLIASLCVPRHESRQLSGCVLCVFRGVSRAYRPRIAHTPARPPFSCERSAAIALLDLFLASPPSPHAPGPCPPQRGNASKR